MKKNHIFNQSTGKCFCGINSNNQSLAFNDENNWFDSNVYPIDHSNYAEKLCVNCMKNYDMQLIDKFEMEAFLIDYQNRLPNGKRAMKFFKAQSRLKRKSNQSSNVIEKSIEKPIEKPIIEKSAKGKKRDERKKANQLKNSNQLPSDDKCKIIAKPEPIEEPIIELKESDMVFLLPDCNWRKESIIKSQSKLKKEKPIEVIEDIDPSDNWSIGDPINDDSIFEMVIGNDWKLIRHSKDLNQWKFVNRKVVKGIPKWIDDSDFIDYQSASELIKDGYCE